MSFDFQVIKYGWIALSSIVLTGITIFVSDNDRWQVNQVDVIQPVLGEWERCEVTKSGASTWGTAPLTYIASWRGSNGMENVTNAIGMTIDQQLLVNTDPKIRASILKYVDTNSVFDGMTNVEMLTVAGVWGDLGVGDSASLFTRTPSINGNPATYGELSGQIYTDNLSERYKTIWMQVKTKPVATITWKRVRQGHGCGMDHPEAVGAAESDYHLVDEGPLPSWEIRESAKAAFWSNYVYWVPDGGGGGSAPGEGGGSGGTSGAYLVTDYVTNYVTNLVVTGAIDPIGAVGTYVEGVPYGGNDRTWYGPGVIYSDVGGIFNRIYYDGVDCWDRFPSIEGEYSPYPSVPDVSTGTAYVAFSLVPDSVTETNHWEGGGNTNAGGGGEGSYVTYSNPTEAGTNPIGTVYIFYECWITKVVCTNDSFCTTNIGHKAEYWVNPSIINLGNTNIYSDEGISGFTEGSYHSAGVNAGWLTTSNSPVPWRVSTIMTPPEDAPEPTEPNTTAASGFQLGSPIGILEWSFQYCTNKYW